MLQTLERVCIRQRLCSVQEDGEAGVGGVAQTGKQAAGPGALSSQATECWPQGEPTSSPCLQGHDAVAL